MVCPPITRAVFTRNLRYPPSTRNNTSVDADFALSAAPLTTDDGGAMSDEVAMVVAAA